MGAQLKPDPARKTSLANKSETLGVEVWSHDRRDKPLKSAANDDKAEPEVCAFLGFM